MKDYGKPHVSLYTSVPPVSQYQRLLDVIAAAYQIAGYHCAPAHVLDVLANPSMATQEQIDAMLPYYRAAPPLLTDEQMPPLPESLIATMGYNAEPDTPLFTADQLHTYARAVEAAVRKQILGEG